MKIKYKALSIAALAFYSTTPLAGECTSSSALLPNSITAATRQSLFSISNTKPNIAPEDLNEFEFSLKTYKVNTDGSLTFVAGSLTDTNALYKTLYVFNQYKTDNNTKYGVSIRLEVDFKTNSASFSAANLFNGLFGLKASTDKLDGTISMSVHGMKNPKAAYILPVPTKIDDTSAAQFLNYMSLIKSMIGEANSIDPVTLPSCI